jgi:hypothetical protein
MLERWVDVSSHQRPELMRWSAWGIRRGQYRLRVGQSPDAAGPEHRRRMRLAQMLTGSYAVPWEGNDQADDCWRWVDAIQPDDENDDWVDAERERLTEPELDAYCTAYDRRGRERLAIYTGKRWWEAHVPPARRARYAHYKLIIAAYPFDSPAGQYVPMDPISVALRSTPPHLKRPDIPAPWTVEDGWQHTGQGSLPGYVGFLDMGVYRVNPGTAAPPVAAAADVAAHAAAIVALVAP